MDAECRVVPITEAEMLDNIWRVMLSLEEYTILIHKLAQAADSLKQMKRDTREFLVNMQRDTNELVKELDSLADEFRKAKEP